MYWLPSVVIITTLKWVFFYGFPKNYSIVVSLTTVWLLYVVIVKRLPQLSQNDSLIFLSEYMSLARFDVYVLPLIFGSFNEKVECLGSFPCEGWNTWFKPQCMFSVDAQFLPLCLYLYVYVSEQIWNQPIT